DRVTGDHTIVAAFHEAIGAGLDELLRDDTAHDLVENLDALALLVGLHADDNMAVLAFAARLPDELSFTRCGAENGFAVGDLGFAGGRLDFELTTHAVDDDVEVKFTHAGENDLSGIFVSLDGEGRIFGDEPL